MKNNIGERLLFIDTETGGIDPTKHTLFSIGLVVWDSTNGILDSKEILIKSDEYIITKEAQRINRFERDTHELTALPPKKAIERIIDFNSNWFDLNMLVPLAGHNTQFDVSFIKTFLKENNRSYNEIFSHRIIDTYTLLRSLYYAGKITDDISSSAQAFKYFNIKVENRHSAQGDAIATAELFEKLLKLMV